MGNIKAKINQHIRPGQNTTCFTYLLTLLIIIALPLKENKVKLDCSVDVTIKINRFNFHEVVGEVIKTVLMLLVSV